MADKEKRTQENDLLMNKMMAALCIACIDLMLVMGIRWGYASDAFPFFYTATKVLMYMAIGAASAGIYRAVIEQKNAEEKPKKVFTGAFVAGFSLLLAFVCYEMAYADYLSSAKFLFIFIPAVCALYVVYMVYHREFFTIALAGAVIAVYIWRFARFSAGSVGFYVLQAILLLVLLGLLTAFVLMDRSGGTITVRGVRYRFLSPDARFMPVIIGLGILAAFVLAMFFIPAGFFMYFAYAAAALVFFLAVYFTVIML